MSEHKRKYAVGITHPVNMLLADGLEANSEHDAATIVTQRMLDALDRLGAPDEIIAAFRVVVRVILLDDSGDAVDGFEFVMGAARQKDLN